MLFGSGSLFFSHGSSLLGRSLFLAGLAGALGLLFSHLGLLGSSLLVGLLGLAAPQVPRQWHRKRQRG